MDGQAGFGATHEGETPFGFEELFYSRTDKRGMIEAGNAVFQRVSGYEWQKLLGAPHNLVRHRDMPKGVFYLMWNAIQKGFPIAAYVRNRCENGEFYWVLAVILPIENGYLSVRLKPSTETFDRMKSLYAELSDQEKSFGLSAENSAKLLQAEAIKQGFSSYSSFIAFALCEELKARDTKLKRGADRRTKMLAEINLALEKATDEQVRLLRSFEALQSVPNNMRIVASRLEPAGGPVSAISENYKASSQVISQRLASFVGGEDNICDMLSREVARVLFLIGCNRILVEMDFQKEGLPSDVGIDWEKEQILLKEIEQKCSAQAREAMTVAIGYAADINRSSAEIRRQMLGLDTIRVLGRVECGRMRDVGGLSTTIDQLDSFHADIKQRLEAIMELSEVIENAMSSYMRSA
ncbi:PAS domain-containing protein [Rhodobacteraceae bacterium]|nr:PAS domain-containing protein [Paracoccaceae bacterium]